MEVSKLSVVCVNITLNVQDYVGPTGTEDGADKVEVVAIGVLGT